MSAGRAGNVRPRDYPLRILGRSEYAALMTSPELEDYQWLVGPEAERWLNELAAPGTGHCGTHRSIAAGIVRVSHAFIAGASSACAPREAKFADAPQMFFTAVGLEQATDEWVAGYKASRFPQGLVAELCCGIGGDLLALVAPRPGAASIATRS